jgi:hypothetical protein
MIRNLKALGSALVAIFAMSAVVASAAQATAGTLTSEGKSVIVTAEQVGEHQISFTDHLIGGQPFGWKCKKVTFTGTQAVSEGATTLQTHPIYQECIVGGLNATITTTGCDYLFHIGTPTLSGGWHVTTDIVCNAGSVIKIVTATCEMTIGGQTGLTTSELTNAGGVGTAMDLLLHTSITDIKYTVNKDGIGCPLSGTGSFSKADYVGTTTVKGHDSTTQAPVGITLH